MLHAECSPPRDPRLKVSVLMITYNHEKYISQALNSIVSQKVNFDYEIVIGEDCSTDRTRDLISDFQKIHPKIVRPLLRERNVGLIKNFVLTLQACRSQYIALLEGDDYWTCPHKLQTQVDFLDNHTDCAICFHSVIRLHQDGYQEIRNHIKEISTVEDILGSNFIATCSTMFRKGLFSELPEWFYRLRWADWPLHILNAQHGNIGYINKVMGTYRMHREGVWSSLTETQMLEQVIEFLEDMNSNLELLYDDCIRIHLSKYYYDLVLEHGKKGHLIKAGTYAFKWLAKRTRMAT